MTDLMIYIPCITGRSNSAEITVFKSLGLAVEDLGLCSC